MTRRTQLALCAYTLSLVLFAFVQAMHNVFEADDTTSPTAVQIDLIASNEGQGESFPR